MLVNISVGCFAAFDNDDSDHFTAIILVNLFWMALPVKNWRVLLKWSFMGMWAVKLHF